MPGKKVLLEASSAEPLSSRPARSLARSASISRSLSSCVGESAGEDIALDAALDSRSGEGFATTSEPLSVMVDCSSTPSSCWSLSSPSPPRWSVGSLGLSMEPCWGLPCVSEPAPMRVARFLVDLSGIEGNAGPDSYVRAHNLSLYGACANHCSGEQAERHLVSLYPERERSALYPDAGSARTSRDMGPSAHGPCPPRSRRGQRARGPVICACDSTPPKLAQGEAVCPGCMLLVATR